LKEVPGGLPPGPEGGGMKGCGFGVSAGGLTGAGAGAAATGLAEADCPNLQGLSCGNWPRA